MQRGQNDKGTGVEYKNARSDFLGITEKNEKQYVRLQLRIPGTQGVVSPVLIVLLMNQ